MKLIGSYPSPFVRRIRILLHGHKFDFQNIDLFSLEGRKVLDSYGPVAKIPILENHKDVIWDSLQIASYLQSKNIVQCDLSHESIKKIVTVNELTDSGIILFQLKKFELDSQWGNAFSQNHFRRITNILSWFNNMTDFSWTLSDQWLFSTLDWFLFRNIVEWQELYPNLNHFHGKNLTRLEVVETEPGKNA